MKGCGTGKFIIDAPEYEDLCIEHDDNWNIATNIWEILGYDWRFVFQIQWRALGFLWKRERKKALQGFAFGLIVILFSWLIYFIKKK